MPPIADRASKRQRNSVGGGGRQLTTIAAAPPQVALDPAVVVPADIERNREAIVAGVAPPRKLSADEKKQRASIVSQLAADFNAFKNSLGDGRSNQYGADKRFFEARRPLYGDWLELSAIRRAAKRQRDKGTKARASVTPVDVTQGDNGDSQESSPSFPRLLQVAPTEANMSLLILTRKFTTVLWTSIRF